MATTDSGLVLQRAWNWIVEKEIQQQSRRQNTGIFSAAAVDLWLQNESRVVKKENRRWVSKCHIYRFLE